MKESVHKVFIFKTRFEVSLIKKKRLLYLLFYVVPACMPLYMPRAREGIGFPGT